MATLIRYKLGDESQPEVGPVARNDGSRMVDFDIKAQSNTDDAGWGDVPNYHKTLSVPADAISAALASGTNNQKVTAIKQALLDNRDTQAIPNPAPPVTDWSQAGIEQYLVDYAAWLTQFNADNQAASDASDALDQFMTVTLGLTYPVTFTL